MPVMQYSSLMMNSASTAGEICSPQDFWKRDVKGKSILLSSPKAHSLCPIVLAYWSNKYWEGNSHEHLALLIDKTGKLWMASRTTEIAYQVSGPKEFIIRMIDLHKNTEWWFHIPVKSLWPQKTMTINFERFWPEDRNWVISMPKENGKTFLFAAHSEMTIEGTRTGRHTLDHSNISELPAKSDIRLIGDDFTDLKSWLST